MRFRTGLIIGLAVGYYYGAKAGRERYLQIEEWLDKVRSTTTVQEARTKLSDGLREGTTAARRWVDEATGGALSQGIEAAEDAATTVIDPTFN